MNGIGSRMSAFSIISLSAMLPVSILGSLGASAVLLVSMLDNLEYRCSSVPKWALLSRWDFNESSSLVAVVMRGCLGTVTSKDPSISSRSVTGNAPSALVQFPRPRFSCASRCVCSVEAARHSTPL